MGRSKEDYTHETNASYGIVQMLIRQMNRLTNELKEIKKRLNDLENK